MAVKLSPFFNEATLDSNGNPWVSAQLFTYAAGSSTKQTTYQDSGASSQHTNPIILNSRGEPPAPIWLTVGETYKFVLTSPTDSDPPVAATRSVDNVSGVNDSSVTLDEWVSGPTPTYVSATSFTLAGDQTSTFTVGRRVKVTDSGGTKYGTIKTSAYGALTTITLDSQDSDALATPTSAVSYGLINPTNTSRPVLSDALAIVGGSADRSKRVRFEVDGITTATTRVITAPDMSLTLVPIIVKRKTADESVTSSTAFQDDDHLSLTIAANEEWILTFDLHLDTSLTSHGFKSTVTVPSGATLLQEGIGFGGAATIAPIYQRNLVSGTALTFSAANWGAVVTGVVKMSVWVLNGATPGTVQLQWAQATSNGAAATVLQGSAMIAHRIA